MSKEILQDKDNPTPTLRNCLQDLMFLEKKICFCTTLQILKAQGGRYFDANLVPLQNDPRILEVTRFTPEKVENQLKHSKVFWNGKVLSSEYSSTYETHFKVS